MVVVRYYSISCSFGEVRVDLDQEAYGIGKTIAKKWNYSISLLFAPRWNVVWHKSWAHMEVAIFWSILNKVMVVNE